MDRLSPREADVAHLVAHGLSNAEIAARLGIARSTVKNHLATCYIKLRVRAGGSPRVILARLVWEESEQWFNQNACLPVSSEGQRFRDSEALHGRSGS